MLSQAAAYASSALFSLCSLCTSVSKYFPRSLVADKLLASQEKSGKGRGGGEERRAASAQVGSPQNIPEKPRAGEETQEEMALLQRPCWLALSKAETVTYLQSRPQNFCPLPKPAVIKSPLSGTRHFSPRCLQSQTFPLVPPWLFAQSLHTWSQENLTQGENKNYWGLTRAKGMVLVWGGGGSVPSGNAALSRGGGKRDAGWRGERERESTLEN